MNKKLFIITAVFVLFAASLSVGVCVASDITGADFYGTITVTNNSTATTNVATTISGANTTALIAGGYLNATATNCAIQYSGADVAFMPGWGPYPWCVFVPTIGNNAQTFDTLYVKGVTGGKLMYFPGSTGMTVSDGMTEPGNNFGITINDAWINTTAGASKDIISHWDATIGGIQLFVSPTVSGNITGRIITLASSVNSSALRPTGAGTYTENTPSAGANWQCAGDNNDATYVWNSSNPTYKRDTYVTANHTTESGAINTVTFYFRIQDSTATAQAKPLLISHSTLYTGTNQSDGTHSFVTKNESWVTNPVTGNAWTWDEIDDLQIGISMACTNNGVDNAQMADCWIIINYSTYVYTDVTGTGITSGEHDVILRTELR